MNKEIFKPIPNYEGLYEISNYCNVKSLPRKVQRGRYNAWRNSPEKILTETRGDVSLSKNGKKKTFDTQTLFKIVFEGFSPDGKRKVCLINNNGKVLEVRRRQVCQIIKSLKPRKSETTGVRSSGSYFRSDICINQKDIYLGTFENINDASKMYKLACDNEKLYEGNAKDFRIKLNSISDNY